MRMGNIRGYPIIKCDVGLAIAIAEDTTTKKQSRNRYELLDIE